VDHFAAQGLTFRYFGAQFWNVLDFVVDFLIYFYIFVINFDIFGYFVLFLNCWVMFWIISYGICRRGRVGRTKKTRKNNSRTMISQKM